MSSVADLDLQFIVEPNPRVKTPARNPQLATEQIRYIYAMKYYKLPIFRYAYFKRCIIKYDM